MTNIDRKNPLQVTIKERYPLTKDGSSKETYHITLDLKDKNLEFQVGDSIGIFAQNDPILVEHLLIAMKATGDEIITHQRSGEKCTARQFLTSRANLSRISSSFLKLLHENAHLQDKKNQLHSLLQTENKALLQHYLATYDPLDLLKEYAEIQAPLEEMCNQFSPLLPRFYSVASSRKSHPDQVDLVVTISTFTHSGEKRYGVASHFLCHLAEVSNTPIPIYVQPAHNFRLPQDHTADIIMVGPGTGIAPFRGFLQERLHFNAQGNHWLFFGERHSALDFYYEDFFTHHHRQNRLKLHLAFSRDQEEKIYVQHRILENAAELWQWMQDGAYFYVCGDAENMAKDVDAALHQIISLEGNMSADDAKAYVKNLRVTKRYQTDVY